MDAACRPFPYDRGGTQLIASSWNLVAGMLVMMTNVNIRKLGRLMGLGLGSLAKGHDYV